MVDQNPKNGRGNATQLNSSQPARMLSDAPHHTLTPLRLFDLNSTSINPSPDMGDPPLPVHPQLVHTKKEEENEGSARFSNYPDKHRHRNSSMESQRLEDWSSTLTTNHSGNNDMIQAQEKHGVETAAFSLIGAHSLGLNKQSTESIANGEFRELSFKEQLVPKDRSNKFGEQAPLQAGLQREDSMDVLNTVEDGPVNFKTKYENTVIKITGSHKDEKVFLSGVASAFYNGGSLSLHGVLCFPSIDKINEFLDEQREELHAGVPGKWLTVVLGRDSSELSTIVATAVYAYFLSLTAREDQLCIVPLVNMVRADLALHPDVTWLLDSVGLHLPSLLFLDEINLSYFHRFGSLRLVLVNHTMLCPGQESFKDDVEEILAVDEKVDTSYPHLKRVKSDKDVGSSCTLIAEDFTKYHPELLAGRALCRLLLAGIVLDTKNLSSERTTRRDISMATLLLNGAGKFGRHGLYKILKQKSHDLTNMSTNQLLRKQFKMLTIGSSGTPKHSQQACFYEKNVGMSSLPIPVNAVLAWEEDSPVAIADFPRDPPKEPVQEEPPLFDDIEEVLQPEEILRHEENIYAVVRRSGKELEKEPKFFKNKDVGFVKMILTNSISAETFFDYPPLGQFAVRDIRQIVVVGLVKAVNEREGCLESNEERLTSVVKYPYEAVRASFISSHEANLLETVEHLKKEKQGDEEVHKSNAEALSMETKDTVKEGLEA
ncbi:hypothetical protein L7F22_017585 [Adiantum nelumboides]|nr:hypothetical protein [Adiantum nelumboides]